MSEFTRVGILSKTKVRPEGLFKKGRVVVGLGSGEVDLSAAQIAPEGADLTLVGVLGSILIILPANARILVSGATVLGSQPELRPEGTSVDPEAPQLEINAWTFLGSIRFK
jgi:hypothetical protein